MDSLHDNNDHDGAIAFYSSNLKISIYNFEINMNIYSNLYVR